MSPWPECTVESGCFLLRECTHDVLWLNLNDRTTRAVAGEYMKVPRHVHLIVIPQHVSDRCP